MKIIEIKVMRGPNYWSIRRKKLIVMKLDLETLEELPTNKIDGFEKRIKEWIPSLIEHRCSEGKEVCQKPQPLFISTHRMLL